jgi:hypothetical protein
MKNSSDGRFPTRIGGLPALGIGNRLLPVAGAIILAIALLLPLWAGITTHRLSLTILTDKDDEFVLLADLDSRAFSRIENDPTTGIQPFLLQARRDYAEKIGYRRDIYGEENYKMVVIRKYSFVVRDVSRDQVVLKR